jgi:hypothetical protein
MLNKTSSFYRPKSIKRIDFKVMGLDDITSDYLNWALAKRDNLEMLKQYNTFEIKSNSAELHFNHLSIIEKIVDKTVHRRI